MGESILSKIRRLNWVLSESSTGNLSYSDLGKILCKIINANVLITNIEGVVLGAGYINTEDSSTVLDDSTSVTGSSSPVSLMRASTTSATPLAAK